MPSKGYAYKEVSFYADGDICYLKFKVTPVLAKRGHIHMEVHDWDSCQGEDGHPLVTGVANDDTLLNLAAACLSIAGQHKLAELVQNERGQQDHRVYPGVPLPKEAQDE